MRDQRRTIDPECLTDDQAQLIYERQRLAIVETKQTQAVTAIDRWYYEKCAAGWRRSIGVLEREIQETQCKQQ